VTSAAKRLDLAALQAWPLPSLEPEADKEARGRVVIVAGSREIPGAAILAAEAALRAGAGKVLIGTGESVAMQVAVAMPELRVIGLPENAAGGLTVQGLARLDKALGGACAVLVGPGMQDEEAAIQFAVALRQRYPQLALVLDATALGAVSREALPGGPVLITPHAGEMAHLSGQPKDVLLAEPESAASTAALGWNAIVALKGATTVIADPQGELYLHEGGNVGLATAGSGDVLAGLIVGFAARGAPLLQAAAWGVVVHGLAGELLAERLGGVGYLASELAVVVPEVLQGLPVTAPKSA
jgi:ADP-dependent NAD(P)H-hydrate dehydratase